MRTGHVDPSGVQSPLETTSHPRVDDSDQAVVDVLVRRHWLPVVAYVRSLIDDQDAAEDIAQEAFLYLWQVIGRRTGDDASRALLYRAARHRALNLARGKRVAARTAPVLQAISSAGRGNPTPLQVLEQAELRSALDEAIYMLPPRCREVFVLGYVHGCRHVEVARIMGISEQTARNQMCVALAKLRVKLQALVD